MSINLSGAFYFFLLATCYLFGEEAYIDNFNSTSYSYKTGSIDVIGNGPEEGERYPAKEVIDNAPVNVYYYSCSNVLDYEFYDSSPAGNTFTNIPTSGALSAGTVSSFDVNALQNSVDPGDTDNYSVRFKGYINIANAGSYTFYTSSDDGSALYIDGSLIVNNDGAHGVQERSGTLNLATGLHAIEVLFFENAGGQSLTVQYAGPSIAKQNIPFSVLSSDCGTSLFDTDNDGIPDDTDLDDDNDGILDSVECGNQATGVQTATNISNFSNVANAQGIPGTSFAQNPLTYSGTSLLLLKFPTSIPIGTEISLFLGADPSVSTTDMQVQRSTSAGGNNGWIMDATVSSSAGISEYSFTVTGSALQYIRIEAYQTGARVYGASYGIECEDTDNDGIINSLDTDSDADGCTDADEGYDNLNADTDNNGRYGSGAPTVDAAGKVVGASYAQPVDSDTDGIPNFLEAGGTPTITAQPQDLSANPGDTANFSVSAAGSNLVYQWYVSTNGGSSYTALSGKTSSSLIINNVSAVEDGKLYRVIVRDVNNLCSTLTSVSAVLQISNMPPVVDAEGDQDYCPGLSIPIAESISITDPDDTVTTAVFIQISSGYVNGEDLLTMTGTHPNITATWNAVEGELSLTGPATYSEFETAILAVEYSSSAGAPTGWRQFSITVGEANYLPATGHYYMYVDDLGITWTEANSAANASTYFGQQGYLATLTSQEEADFSGSQAAGTGWIGGSDAATEGVWKWVTGPEAGLTFWNGTAGGSSPNFAFWNTGEPNNSGNEDYAHITHPNINPNGSWNDLTNTGSTSGDYQPQGYVVEYGGMPGDPTLNITDVTSITMVSYANITLQPVDQTTCLGADATFSVSATGVEAYQWQLFDGSIWNNLTDTGMYSGTTTATLSLAGPLMADSGNRYRLILSSDCTVVTSNTANLTVTDVVVDAGSDQSICGGDSVTLTAIPSGGTAGYTYLWNTGQTTSSITIIPPGNPNADTYIDYTVTVTDTNSCQDTDTVRVKVESAPTATVTKTDASCGLDNGAISFNFPDHPNRSAIKFSLDNQSTYQSSVADNSGSVTYNGLAAGTYHLWVRWGNNECPVDLGNHTILDIPQVTIVTHPSDQVKFVNENASFSVSANNMDTYKWQVSINGGGSFTDISDGPEYSGTQTASLTISTVSQNMSGYLYRTRASHSTTTCTPVISNAALLTVNNRTVITNRRITHRVSKN